MISSSFVQKTHVSPLEQAMGLKPGKGAGKKRLEMAPILPLTALIDAFSILVIYLLIGTQSGGLEMSAPNSMHLPVAHNAQSMDKESPVIRIEKGQYFINDKVVASQSLSAKLAELKTSLNDGDSTEILIQADTAMNYADLDPLLKAGSEAGIQKLKFAVLPAAE